MMLTEEGQQILEHQPRMRNIDLESLSKLPSNTLGYRYSQFMLQNKFSPEDRPLSKYMSNYDTAYVKQRYKETHDFYHVLLDLEEINVLNEIKVKYFEMIHFGLPSTFFSVFFGKFLLNRNQLSDLFSSMPSLANQALNSKFLLAVWFEKYFDQDFEDFKNEININ